MSEKDKQIIEGEFAEEKEPMMTQIVKHESDVLAPAGSIDDLVDRYNLQAEFVNKVLKEGTDYGFIPGTEKKTLLKAGAEKITTLFGLSSEFPKELQHRVEDWTGEDHGGEPFFFYEDTCRLTKDGVLIAEASGSCNSWEKKYRYRTSEIKCPVCGKEGTVIKGKEEYGGGWLCWAKKGGCGAKWDDGDPVIESQDRDTIPNPFIFDQVNTIKKMCQKRAYVAAVLMAGNVSDYFTQDVEDSDEIGPSVSTSPPKKETTNPAEVRVGFPKAKELFDGTEPTVADLFSKDPDYCDWIYNNGKGPVADAMRKYIDTQATVQRQAKDTGMTKGVDMLDAIEDAETILAQTNGNLTPTHYWSMARKMNLDERVAADIASDCDGDWRKSLQSAVDYMRGKK